MNTNDKIKNYVVDIKGKKYILHRYQKIILNNVYFIFLGIFNTDQKVPNVTCIYIKDDKLIAKYVKQSCVPKENRVVTIPKTHSVGDDQLLKLNIVDEDDELMMNMKALLIRDQITVGEFKDMYGDDRKTDMNNDKSRLENKHTLSWKKFVFLIKLLGHKYELTIYDDIPCDNV